MTVRRPLQDQLLAAWRYSIEGDYSNQRINSERSLQASFWAQLNKILPPKRRRMFIEPRLAFTAKGKSRSRYPDIVICNTKSVIAVVELKYLPRGIPNFANDIRKLRAMARYRRQLSVENTRYRGVDADTRCYPFAESVLFVWAGVHRPSPHSFDDADVPLLSDRIDQLQGCFMQLHAETDERDAPHVFARIG